MWYWDCKWQCSTSALLDQGWFQGASELPWSFKGMKRGTVQVGAQWDWYAFNGSPTPKINQHDAKLLVQRSGMTVEWLLFVCGLVPLPRVEETKAYLYARSVAWIWIKAWYNDIDWYCMRGGCKKNILTNLSNSSAFAAMLTVLPCSFYVLSDLVWEMLLEYCHCPSTCIKVKVSSGASWSDDVTTRLKVQLHISQFWGGEWHLMDAQSARLV